MKFLEFKSLLVHKKQIFFYGVFIFFFTLLWLHIRQPTAVIFDFKSTYTTFVKEALERKLPEEELKKLGRHFALTVAFVCWDYSQRHHVVIYNKGAIMAGAEDVTEELQRLIAKEMEKSTKE